MGYELSIQKNKDISFDNNNENDDLFQIVSDKNKLILNYKIDYPGEIIRLIGKKFYENNKNNCQMCINFVRMGLLEFYESKNEERFIKVVLAIRDIISDLSYMFSECSSLVSIDNLCDLNINNVINLSYMFFGCSSLTSLSDISEWKTDKVTNMSHMFHGCSSLKLLARISKWKTNNVTDISYMFYGCSSLTSLDDISIWNISKVNDISELFYNCPLLNDKERILNVFLKKNHLLKSKNDNKIIQVNEIQNLEIPINLHNKNSSIKNNLKNIVNEKIKISDNNENAEEEKIKQNIIIQVNEIQNPEIPINLHNKNSSIKNNLKNIVNEKIKISDNNENAEEEKIKQNINPEGPNSEIYKQNSLLGQNILIVYAI